MATCLGSDGLRLSNVGPIQVARNWAEWWGLKIIRLNYRNPILNDPRAERFLKKGRKKRDRLGFFGTHKKRRC